MGTNATTGTTFLRLRGSHFLRQPALAAGRAAGTAHKVAGAIGERSDLTLGHQAVGIIDKLGSAVKGFREGDRVAVNAITPCYQCHNCLRGFSSQCQQMLGGWKFANVKDGNLAEFFHVNNAMANRRPSRIRSATNRRSTVRTCCPRDLSGPSTPPFQSEEP